MFLRVQTKQPLKPLIFDRKNALEFMSGPTLKCTIVTGMNMLYFLLKTDLNYLLHFSLLSYIQYFQTDNNVYKAIFMP